MSISSMEGDIGGLSTGAEATELGPNKRAVAHFGRSSAESEKIDQNSME